MILLKRGTNYLKKNSLDLNNVNPECIEIRDKINRVEKDIRELKFKYEGYNKRLMLSREEAGDKAGIGHELYALNIKAIALIQELAMCQEGRSMEMV